MKYLITGGAGFIGSNYLHYVTEKYPEDKDMTTEVKETAEYYYTMYEQYQGITKEEFLSQNGFTNEDASLEALKLDHRRNKYYEEYAEGLVSDKDIEKKLKVCYHKLNI